ncbi:MAG: esterase-like activity of phytase family protein, partial [Gemmataceae bacterium]|nr:esterase-like activity of phytase family protein [Gemmataceae bacterium]
EFLVLERDNKKDKDCLVRKIVQIDLREATDISGVEMLPPTALPKSIRPVGRKTFLDLLEPRFRTAVEESPKFEGLAFGPDLPDGRRLLLVTVDNDFHAHVPTRIFAFGIDRADLPTFRPQEFDRPFAANKAE